MSRSPVHLLPAGGLGPQDMVWAALRRLRGGTLQEIADAAGTLRAATRDYLNRLARGGVVSRDTTDREVRYRLERDMGVETPRLRKDGGPATQGQGREALWRTMRVLKEFGVDDLAAHVRAAGIAVALGETRQYCIWLCRAGYLARISKPGCASRWRWVPSRYTGPRPPMIQRIKQLYDPNLGQVVWRSGDNGGDA